MVRFNEEQQDAEMRRRATQDSIDGKCGVSWERRPDWYARRGMKVDELVRYKRVVELMDEALSDACQNDCGDIDAEMWQSKLHGIMRKEGLSP